MSSPALSPSFEFPKPPPIDSIIASYLEYEASLLEQETTFVEQKKKNRKNNTVSYLNQAAFGDPYPTTLQLRQHLIELCYQQPMVYHRSIVPKLVLRSKTMICQYLGILAMPPTPPSSKNKEENNDSNDYDDDDDSNHDTTMCSSSITTVAALNNFSFINITGALFGVLKGVRWQPGDIVVTSDMLYHSLTDTLLCLQHEHSLEWITVTTPHGARQDDIYDAFRTCLEELRSNNKQIRLVVLDHVSSKPAVRFPVERICQLCRRTEYRIPTLVDGAHIPGSCIVSSSPSQPTVDIPRTIGATFYAVTFHKWCYTPRGGAAGGLFVNQQDILEFQYDAFLDISGLVAVETRREDDEKTTTTGSNSLDLYLDPALKPGFVTDIITQGIYDESTREYENILVLPHCLKLVERFQADFRRHVESLRWPSLQLLQRLWNLDEQTAMVWYGDRMASTTEEAEEHVVEIPMLSVPLPTQTLLDVTMFSSSSLDLADLGAQLKGLKKHLVPRLWHEYAVEVPITVWKKELLAVRITFGRHVSLHDVERLGHAVLDIMDKGIVL